MEATLAAGEFPYELQIMKADGSHPRRVYVSKNTKRFVVFAPNGRRLFFMEEIRRGIAISSVSVDGSDYHQITVVD